MPIAKVVSGWRKLFTGGNGLITNSLRVEALNHVPGSGYSQFWELNDASFRNCPEQVKDQYGLSDEEYEVLSEQLTQLDRKQRFTKEIEKLAAALKRLS